MTGNICPNTQSCRVLYLAGLLWFFCLWCSYSSRVLGRAMSSECGQKPTKIVPKIMALVPQWKYTFIQNGAGCKNISLLSTHFKISMVMENYPVVSLLPPPFHCQPFPLSLLLFLPFPLMLPFPNLLVFPFLLFHHQPGDFLSEPQSHPHQHLQNLSFLQQSMRGQHTNCI